MLAGVPVARADVGATLSLQTDARERGITYSDGKPSAQFGVAWDGDGGWYAGMHLAHARFVRRSGWRLRAYGGRVVDLAPGVVGEVGAITNVFENVPHYNFHELYAGLLGERWSLRLYHSPNYYGSGQRSIYGEFDFRLSVAAGMGLMGHLGVLHGYGKPDSGFYADPNGPTRVDLRAGASWQVGDGWELQLAWESASRGGPYTWADSAPGPVLGVTAAF